MHDPWDVATTRRSDQYLSCMKINGVPLLPPILSKQCRKEMQYYKVLAVEVEKRLSLLNTLVEGSNSIEALNKDGLSITDTDSVENDSMASDREKSSLKNDPDEKDLNHADINVSNGYDSIRSDITVLDNSDLSPVLNSPKLVFGVNIAIGDIFSDKLNVLSKNITDETPERDYNCVLNKQVTSVVESEKTIASEVNNEDGQSEINTLFNDKTSSITIGKDSLPKTIGPPSLSSSKSVDDIHVELSKEVIPELVRQSSYTILKPSPALLAHLEVQSMTSGVDMSSISMSESCSNLSWLKKRRSWDLESAKVKWSSMATELNTGVKQTVPQKRSHVARYNVRPASQHSPVRAKSTVTERLRRSSVPSSRLMNPCSAIKSGSVSNKVLSKTTESIPSLVKLSNPTQNKTKEPNSDNQTNIDDTPQCRVPIPSNVNVTDIIGHCTANPSTMELVKSFVNARSPPRSGGSVSPVREDPSACIRELYDKIQNQQFLRMASLIEKQKKEQLLLQQVFEEQNSLFYKQLKTICPTSPNEIKEAWSEKPTSKDGPPVSLSQLIHSTSRPSDNSHSTMDMSSTLNQTQNYIHRTEEALKKSRNVLNGIKHSSTKKKPTCVENATSSIYSRSPVVRPKSVPSNIPRRDDKSLNSSTKTFLHSLNNHPNSNGSHSSKEAEPILTDRTNDTMADLNFTLTSDDNADFGLEPLNSESNTTFVKDDDSMDYKAPHSPVRASLREKLCKSGSIDSNMHSSQTLMDYSVQRTKSPVRSERRTVRKLFADRQPTTQELAASARITAAARGYLVRRLLRTERVQATVQTIRDALVCALQLHRDRDGIRGADVDLHRRLIQQITAACYSLNDTFIASPARERCALIAQDRERQRALTAKQMSNSSSYSTTRSLTAAPPRRLSKRKSDIMSHSESGALSCRAAHNVPSGTMTHSSHEMYSGDKWHRLASKKYVAAAKELHVRRPWR